MKILMIITSSPLGTWLAEVTRPYWHFSERGHEVTFASPQGGAIVWDKLSDPTLDGSFEANDLVSLGFLSSVALRKRLTETVPLADVDPEEFDGVHVAGGTGAAVDLYPNSDVERILEHFWAAGKVVGAICHGSIALANNVSRVAGKAATGFTLAEDIEAEAIYGPGFIPNFPQPVMEQAGIEFVHVEPQGVKVVVDGQLITGQNQQSASEYSLQFQHLLTGGTPVTTVA
ncbi:type 1 glutamine amidotransferase domain-containing protein [Sphingobium amiense]|uniref:Type 1 glutamine amidotransferase domain-containing protein n=1 Tax=Sphingobium amiense TaxID=135719 RepID=A0A494W2Z7_9SPHN|nr:type 1 glutamine amidotransferase domain-containing protein [Sphingobium amiense]BBD96987.1 type 1 glutamine amidotransferase domain-containing protein [Sphingobium amiense]